MGFVAHSPPNFGAALTSLGISPGPVVTQTFVSSPLFNKVSCTLSAGLDFLTTHFLHLRSTLC